LSPLSWSQVESKLCPILIEREPMTEQLYQATPWLEMKLGNADGGYADGMSKIYERVDLAMGLSCDSVAFQDTHKDRCPS